MRLFLCALALLMALGCSDPAIDANILPADIDAQMGMGMVPPAPSERATRFLVIASNAPSSMRHGGANVWLCTGTADNVPIQAGVDAASAAGGGIVQFSPGLFTVSEPADAVNVSATGCDLTLSGSTVIVDNFTKWTNGAITDVAVGQVYRLTGGDDGEGNSLEDNKDEMLATVSAVDATTITFAEAVDEEGDPDYTDVDIVRMIGAIELPAKVTLQGSGIHATRVKLADDQDCCLIVSANYTGNTVFAGIENMTLDGNDANQTAGSGESNGIVISDYLIDVRIRDVSLISCEDDGYWFCGPWGLQVMGGWSEHHDGKGFCTGSGGPGSIQSVKIADTEEECLFLRRTGSMVIQSCYIQSDNDWGIYAKKGSGHMIFGNMISIPDAQGTPLGGIYMGAMDSVIANNRIEGDQAGAIGVDVETNPITVMGNSFDSLLPKPVEVGYIANFNVFQGNTRCFGADDLKSTTNLRVDSKIIQVENTSGNSIPSRFLCKRNTSAGTIQIVGAAKTENPLCAPRATRADDAVGHAIVYGYMNYFPIDNEADHGAIVIGAAMCCSDALAGTLEAAASGDWVVAIMEEDYDPPGGGGGTPAHKAVYLLSPEERYEEP